MVRPARNHTASWGRTMVLPLVVLMVGLAILLYPAISSTWNAYHQSESIQGYDDAADILTQAQRESLLSDARAYNQALANYQRTGSITGEGSALASVVTELPDGLEERYGSELAVDVTGIMGYVEVPSLDIHLPIYHGTGAAALASGAGHVEWSSLPTGGAGTHTVIAAHTGSPTSTLFNNLDKVKVGDRFRLVVLDQVLSYQVDSILTVSPWDASSLLIDPNSDLCTLLTCTPYGVNTDRLLVTGHRVDDDQPDAASTVAPSWWPIAVVAIAILVILLIRFLLHYRRVRKAHSIHT